MLSDHWIIAQILAQVCALALLAIGAWHAFPLIRGWSSGANDDAQLRRERRSYLVSTIVEYVLIFQVITLLMFLVTVNNHLPNVINGAMCAAGTLSINPLGYPALLIKIIGLPISAAFIFLNFLDQREPAYPLTPFKLVLIWPALFLLIADLSLIIVYFAHIDPDIIATCCSVSFNEIRLAEQTPFLSDRWLFIAIPLFYTFAAITGLNLFWGRKKPILIFISGTIFIGLAMYTLKFKFVRFIYGLPSHHCLFDMFWRQFYYIGYVIFGAYSGIFIALLLLNVLHRVKSRLGSGTGKIESVLRTVTIISILTAVVIPTAYWLYWVTLKR